MIFVGNHYTFCEGVLEGMTQRNSSGALKEQAGYRIIEKLLISSGWQQHAQDF